MEPLHDRSRRLGYRVRFEGGPRDAKQTVVPALDTGGPPELLLTPGRPDWVYVLAGAPRADGSLPYWWMPSLRLAAPQGRTGLRPEGPDTTTP
jgi:hypothetical protein